MDTLLGPALVFAALLTPGLECPSFIRGDSNQDGDVDLADAIRTLEYLFQEGPAIACHDAADADDDGSVDITDPVYTLLYLFASGNPPPAPGPVECGRDHTPDQLECLSGEGCRAPAVPTDFSGFLRFDYVLSPGLGFCPEIGKVFRAAIVREQDAYRLEMSVLEAGAMGQVGCIDIISGECAIEVSLLPRTLTAEETSAVKEAFSSVPVFHQPDPICSCVAIDPCVIAEFEWDGTPVRGFECSADRLPREAVRAIELLLEGLRS